MRAHLAPLLLVLAAAPAHAGSGAQVSLGAVSGTGATETYRASVVAKVSKSYLSGIKSCYRAALKKRPDLRGKLAINLTVDKRGVPTQVQTGFDKSLDPCVLKAAKGWRFAAPKDDAKAAVEAAFVFEVMLLPSESYTYAQVLEGEGGAVEGDMSKRRPGADLGTQLANVKEAGKVVKVGPGTGGGMGGRASGEIEPGSTKVSSPPTGRITITDKQTFDESTLTVDAVTRKIQAAYFAGIKRCYKQRLAVDPTARGKLRIELTVNEEGRATQPKARGFDTEIETCVTGLMTSWTFAIPKDSDGDVTDAGFAITFSLVPE